MFELHFEFFGSALFFRHMHFNVWLAAFFRFDSDTQIRCNEHTVTVHMHWIQYIIWITFGLIFNYIVFIYRDMKMMWTLSIYYHKTGEAKKTHTSENEAKRKHFNKNLKRQWKPFDLECWFCIEPRFFIWREDKNLRMKQKKKKSSRKKALRIHPLFFASKHKQNESHSFFFTLSKQIKDLRMPYQKHHEKQNESREKDAHFDWCFC